MKLYLYLEKEIKIVMNVINSVTEHIKFSF